MRVPCAEQALSIVLATAAVVCVSSCSTLLPDGSPSGHRARTASNRRDDIVSASSLGERVREELRRGAIPFGVDRAVHELRTSAQTEPSSIRAARAIRLAADILSARYALIHRRADADSAQALFDALARDGRDEVACGAIAAAGDLFVDSRENDHAAARYLAFERRCARQADAARVRGSLASLRPDLARAETASRAHAWMHAAGGGVVASGARGIRRIVVDAGHGGGDPGARGALGTTEASVTLEIARRLAERLSSDYGFEVVLTRDADVFVELESRTRRANEANGDLFVSIHCNSAENREAHGVSTYVLDTASDSVAARVVSRENGDHELEASRSLDVFRILTSLRLVGQRSRSGMLADEIQRTLVGRLRTRYADVADLGVHPARFHVLVGPRMPSVLVEVSFISNAIEEGRLRDEEYRALVAAALARAISAAAAR